MPVLGEAGRAARYLLVPGPGSELPWAGCGYRSITSAALRMLARVLHDEKAVLTDQDRKYVYVLGPGNTAVRKDVELGRSVDGLRVVTGGLSPEDQVIVNGVQKVFFAGMPVKPRVVVMGAPASAERLAAISR
ncbi:MAG: hypothetical protein WBO04_08410 [Steroidobacteraceae bacterium]